jgi:hypothetical protein
MSTTTLPNAFPDSKRRKASPAFVNVKWLSSSRTSQGERYAMNDHSNVFPLRQSVNIDDPLTDILRSGARGLLAQAIELEVETARDRGRDIEPELVKIKPYRTGE